VRLISSAGIKPALLTNGVRLNPELASRLRRAGLSAVLLHIQPSQRRPDTSRNAPESGWRRLRTEKARLLAEHEIKAGLVWIAYRSRLDELAAAIDEVLNSPHLDYLLVTACREFRCFENVEGSITDGLRARAGTRESDHVHSEEVSLAELRVLTERLGLPPFGCVGSNRDTNQLRWLTHLVAVTQSREGRRVRVGIRPGLSDRFFCRMFRLLTGRFVFLFTPPRWQFRIQLACNALTGGGFAGVAQVLLKSFTGHRLFDKHILLQEGPTFLPSGEIEFCDNCPDAVWRDNALVPVCLADRMAPGQTQTSTWKRNTPLCVSCSG
jgi:hypothetical protein